MSEESTTDAHPVKRTGRGKETAMQIGIPTALVTAMLGTGGYFMRSHDMERIEARQDRAEELSRQTASGLIEVRADSINQAKQLDRIDRGVELLNAKFDNMRDRPAR